MLDVAQRLFGARDVSYTILGVEFSDDIPGIWFPVYSDGCRNVIVQITPMCATEMSRACYQMAHEAVHLLYPSGHSVTTILDEGLASHFSIRYMREHLNEPNWKEDIESYRAARVLTERLLAIDVDIIKTIRKRQPSLHSVTPEDIQAAHPAVARDLAEALAQPFKR